MVEVAVFWIVVCVIADSVINVPCYEVEVTNAATDLHDPYAYINYHFPGGSEDLLSKLRIRFCLLSSLCNPNDLEHCDTVYKSNGHKNHRTSNDTSF